MLPGGQKLIIWLKVLFGEFRFAIFVLSGFLEAIFLKTPPDDAHSMSREELASLDLEPGQNPAAYDVPELGVTINFSIFLIHKDQKLVVTDVDGTITK